MHPAVFSTGIRMDEEAIHVLLSSDSAASLGL